MDLVNRVSLVNRVQLLKCPVRLVPLAPLVRLERTPKYLAPLAPLVRLERTHKYLALLVLLEQTLKCPDRKALRDHPVLTVRLGHQECSALRASVPTP